MIELLHDFRHQRPRNDGRTVYVKVVQDLYHQQQYLKSLVDPPVPLLKMRTPFGSFGASGSAASYASLRPMLEM